MNICKFSITHPVSTIVLMLLVVLSGVMCFNKLAVREYPDVDIPTVSIMTNYDGAAASVVETKVTQVIENAVSGIDGINTIQSTSKEGRSTVRIEFNASKNIDVAVNDIRDKISRYLSQLPGESKTPVIAKYDSSSMPIIMASVTSNTMNRLELTDYANRYLVDRFSIINGIADVAILGKQEKSMKIWLKKDLMAVRKISISDIESALKRENVEYPSGRIESIDKEYPVVINRKYNSVKDFQNLTVLKNKGGDFVKLRDIADIEISSKIQRDGFHCNKIPMIGLSISKQSNADTVQIANDVKLLIKEINKHLPNGMEIKVLRDESEFIKDSIKEVYKSLTIAAILVFIIIFVFLGDFKATIIPFITVPISLIGAFSVLYIFGYSINMLTMLAMVLAIGIVVDDSIVVLENIYRRVEDGEDVLTASIEGSKQVIFAVISTTAVLLAVFLPICMWQGKTGKLFSEFAITLSSAVIFSSLVALTLTPMLCSKMLKKDKNKNYLIYNFISKYMKKTMNIYEQLLLYTFSHKRSIISCFSILLGLTCAIWLSLKNEYEPVEDRSVLIVKSRAIEGTGFDTMQKYMDEIVSELYPRIQKNEIANILCMIPGLGESVGAVNAGHLTIQLTDYKSRRSSNILSQEYRKKLNNIINTKSSVILPMGIASKGTYPVQFVIAGPEYSELQKWRDLIINKCKNFRGIIDIDHDYHETTPQFVIDLDKERAASFNISAYEIGSTLETMLGSKCVTTYIEGGREYDVVLQASKDDRNELSDIKNMYVKNKNGLLVSIDDIVSISEVGSPNKLSRFNRNRAITISANVADGYALDECLQFLDGIVNKHLPSYAQVFYKGQSKDLKESSTGLYMVFILAIIISFLVLSSQFESFVSPIIVMLSIPLGAFGAVFALKITGYSLNIYNQIGLLMLIGLSAKQGILIVEFANQLRDGGYELKDAIVKASKLRIRPIIMTGISTVASAIPLMLATGASAASRISIGIVEVFGCSCGVFLIGMFIPVLYMIVFGKIPKSRVY